MKRFSSFFYSRSSISLAIVLTLLTFGYLFIFMIDASKCFAVSGDGVKSLGTSFGFDQATVLEFFSSRTSEMLNCYIEFNTIWDNIFGILYGLMYVMWLSYLLKPSAAKFKWLNLLPFAQVIFDWLENLQLTMLTNSFLSSGTISSSGVQFASTFSILKWMCSSLTFLFILIGIGLRIKRFFSKKSTAN